MSEIIVAGISHRTAPVAVRERVAFAPSEIAAAHDAVGARAIEALVLSTCNRVELYGVFPRGARGADILVELLATMRGVDAATLRGVVYTHTGAAAVRHIHAVAAGLDSLVLGETEILAQLRTALAVARARGTLGLTLERLGASAVNGARWAHRRHGGAGRDSVAERALGEVERVRGSVRGSTVAILGAGELASGAAALARAREGRLVVVNRTFTAAAALASRHDGEAWAWERRHEALAVADVALLCTGARERVIDTAALAQARRAAGERPLVCVDLAVPRALEPHSALLPGITLLDLDALPPSGGLDAPDAAFIAALEQSVDIAVARFDAWRRARAVVHAERLTRGGAA
jgi:glutamyl-tRNA reductase